MRVVSRDRVVRLEYVLEVDGEVVDRSPEGEPLAVLWGRAGTLLPPGLEAALEGHPPGEFRLSVPPERGVGAHLPEKVLSVSRSSFPAGSAVEAGREFLTRDEEGRPVGARVVSVEGERVTVDTNPRLAGATLCYRGFVHEVREASAREREHGHAHGEGGVRH